MTVIKKQAYLEFNADVALYTVTHIAYLKIISVNLIMLSRVRKNQKNKLLKYIMGKLHKFDCFYYFLYIQKIMINVLTFRRVTIHIEYWSL